MIPGVVDTNCEATIRLEGVLGNICLNAQLTLSEDKVLSLASTPPGRHLPGADLNYL